MPPLSRARAKDDASRVKQLTEAARGGQLVFERTHTKADGSVTTERRFAAPDWRAHAWILERRDPERWGAVNVAPPNPPPQTGGFDLLSILEASSVATGASIPKTRIDVTPVEPRDPRPLKPTV